MTRVFEHLLEDYCERYELEDAERYLAEDLDEFAVRLAIRDPSFLSVLALFIFGGEVLEGFAVTMLVGIVTGTYSTVFIASSIAIALSKNVQLKAPVAGSRPVDPEARARRRERRNA